MSAGRTMILACILALNGCNQAGQEPVPSPSPTLQSIDVVMYPNGPADALRELITSEAELAALRTRLGMEAAAIQIPPVDFGRERLVVIALGERPSGGHEVTLELVRNEGSTTLVVHEHSPGPKCMTTMALTHPVALGVLDEPLDRDSVRFEERASIKDC